MKKHCIPDLKCQGLLRGVVRVMKSIPAFEDLDVANTMTLHALRFICTSEWKLCFAQRNLRSCGVDIDVPQIWPLRRKYTKYV